MAASGGVQQMENGKPVWHSAPAGRRRAEKLSPTRIYWRRRLGHALAVSSCCIAIPVVIVAVADAALKGHTHTHTHARHDDTTPVGEAANTEVVTEPVFLLVVRQHRK